MFEAGFEGFDAPQQLPLRDRPPHAPSGVLGSSGRLGLRNCSGGPRGGVSCRQERTLARVRRGCTVHTQARARMTMGAAGQNFQLRHPGAVASSAQERRRVPTFWRPRA